MPIAAAAPDRAAASDAADRPGGVLVAAGIASLGAGAIHAAAAGAHGDPRPAAVAFVVTAVLQLGWGALVLFRSHRLLTLAGVAVNAAAVVGWVLAKTSGVGFVEGLEESEPAQFADSVAAALAVVAVAGAVAALAGARVPSVGRPRPALAGLAAVAALGLAAPAMVQTGGHTHAGGGHAHGEEAAAGGHDHGTPAAAPPEPYLARSPVDLGGVPGVSSEEQARAEDLVEQTLVELPRFADPEALPALGWHSIGDSATGYEHYINWDVIDDDTMLDPSEPESLVFTPNPDGTKTLAAAMFMLPGGTTLDQVPELGGPLTQWHIHDDLCFTDDPTSPVVGLVTDVGGECPPPLEKFDPAPMIHVWVRPHECGPFSALEGIGGGQVAEGETRLCDTAHGHGG